MSKYRLNYADYIMDDYAEKVFVYLPGASIKSANYDKFRDVGYAKGQQNYLTVKGWIRQIVTNELIIKQLGVVSIGGIKVIIKNMDVPLFKLASRIVYNNEEYYVYNDAVGKKMMMINLDHNYTEITLFKKDV
jgi:hypothetical protein